MKKSILSLLLVASIVSLSAQTLFDASRYAKYDIMGTARYMALAGSMGAIGGDPSAIYDNPGALGIYRSSEISFTLNASPSVTFAPTSTYLSEANHFFFNFNQFSYVLALASGKETGYVSSNFSFSYNRLRDFNREVFVREDNVSSMNNMIASLSQGFNPSAIVPSNSYAPYLSVLGYQGYGVNPGAGADSTNYYPAYATADKMAYRAYESGRIDEYNFSYAANIGHYLYIGASIGLQTINYSRTSTSAEAYAGDADMSITNVFKTSGLGTVLRIGVIARPFSFLRLGFSFQSPVWYSMHDSYYASVDSRNLGGRNSTNYKLDYAMSDYKFNSPLRFQASVGIIFGKTGFINVDYRYTHNSGMSFVDNTTNNNLFAVPLFAAENADIKNNALTSHMLKVGAEIRIAQIFSIRAGAAYETKNISSDASWMIMDNSTRTDLEVFHDLGTIYAGGGFGYRYNGFGVDLTYAYNRSEQYFSPYQSGATLSNGSNGVPKGYFALPSSAQRPAALSKIHTNHHNVVLTLLYKF